MYRLHFRIYGCSGRHGRYTVQKNIKNKAIDIYTDFYTMLYLHGPRKLLGVVGRKSIVIADFNSFSNNMEIGIQWRCFGIQQL